MSYPFGNEHFPYGRAAFVSEAELEAAGMFEYTPDALYCGKAYGRRLWMRSPGGCVVVAGARLGKLTDFLIQNLSAGVLPDSSALVLDPKGEMACVALDQAADRKFVIHWNPHNLHAAFGLQQHRINPWSHLRWSSETLFSDVKQSMRGLLLLSGAAHSQYFELNARRVAEAIALTLIKENGVLTFPDLYDAVMWLAEAGERWLDFAYRMYLSGIPECISVEAEVFEARKDGSGGWKGILGELQKALSALSDRSLRESLSPPFDFAMEDLCREDRAYHFHMIPPASQIEDWSPIIRSIFTSARVLKERAPGAPRQLWVLDEAGRLSGFSEVVQLFTDGAGIGIRPVVILQHLKQARAFCPHGDELLLSSAATQIYFGMRDPDTARRVSEMIGGETLEYDDPLIQSRAGTKRRQIIRDVLAGSDPFAAAFDLDQSRYETEHRSRKHRLLRTPSELLNMKRGEMIVFADGLSGPIDGTREPYWEQSWMAGKYLPNPFHKPHDKVRVQTRWGKRWRKVIEEPAPEAFAHYPQNRHGMWRHTRRSSRV